MKVFVYGYRKEEAAYFSACAKAMQLEIGTCAQRPTLEILNPPVTAKIRQFLNLLPG